MFLMTGAYTCVGLRISKIYTLGRILHEMHGYKSTILYRFDARIIHIELICADEFLEYGDFFIQLSD